MLRRVALDGVTGSRDQEMAVKDHRVSSILDSSQ